ncbi:linker histone h1 and h5 family domain-containing protein [Ditylenchus destructor]|uniref:Linker histone h1 and h5 family domain-containing protein n=1 Tax=Ditylenchus destructor TaxID=166010 RepID=A0AAD4QSV5_9BILA|nr:linker histone h1 and h5 family domain-containing protein [Ditylenchus destructor]
MSVMNNTNGRDGILSCEQMVVKALSEVGHRKALSEVEIFQHMRRHFHYQIGTNYSQTKLDVRQVLKRGTTLGTIEEVKGFGSWSLYRIPGKKNCSSESSQIGEQVDLKRKQSALHDSSISPKNVSSSYSLRTLVVRTPFSSLSQKSTVSQRTKGQEQWKRSVSSSGPSSSLVDPLKSSKFKTPIWKKALPECPPVLTPANFETPVSVTTCLQSPACNIKFKKIGVQSGTVPSTARLHHRKVAMDHPAYEEMIEKILTQLGERKALSEADIFKYLVLRFRVGSDYAKIKTDLKQAIRRGVIFGTVKEVKGYGQWSTCRIVKKENDYLSAVSAKHTLNSSTPSQSILSTSSPIRMPSEMKSQIRTPIWKKDRRDPLNDSMPSSLSLNSSFSSNLSTSLSSDDSFDSGYKSDRDDMDGMTRKTAWAKKIAAKKHYLVF